MPYFRVSMSQTLTPEKAVELSNALGEALETLPGKTRNMIILDLEDGKKFLVGGELQQDFVFADIHYVGNFAYTVKCRFTEAVFAAFTKVLGTPAESASLTITERHDWGGFGNFRDMLYSDV